MYILRVLVFIASILGGFAYIARQIPQEVSMPPQEEKFDAAKVKTVDDIVEIGQKIFFGKGQCALCHALGGGTSGRCPNLGGENPVGIKLTREFEYETYTNPEAYVYMDFTSSPPKRFAARMPQINKPPIGLTEPEMLTVFSFLQKSSGSVEITPEEVIALAVGQHQDGAAPAVETVSLGDAVSGKEVFTKMECALCHKIGTVEGGATSAGGDKGPDLLPVLNKKEIVAIRSAIFEKSAYHPAAYDEKMTVKEMKDILSYLVSFKGHHQGAGGV
ncbi:MAG: c-type cytochrome [Nitrospirae bacterium]|nr:c-type cytochrome [Candidatus Troglogloeales bacterium]